MLWFSPPESFFSAAQLPGFGFIAGIFYGATAAIAAFTLIARYIFLLAGTGLFPIGIFLYLIPPTNGWGKAIFNLLGVAMAMQFVDVVIISAANQLASEIPPGMGKEFVPAFAFMTIAIANMAMALFAVIKSAFIAGGSNRQIVHSLNAILGEIMNSNSILNNRGNYRAG